MSHIVTIRTQVRDPIAIRRACRRLALPEPAEGKHKLFSAEVEGLAVRLREWKYPVVYETSTGMLHYDNFEGRWGRQEELSRFTQR